MVVTSTPGLSWRWRAMKNTNITRGLVTNKNVTHTSNHRLVRSSAGNIFSIDNRYSVSTVALHYFNIRLWEEAIIYRSHRVRKLITCDPLLNNFVPQ